MGYHRAGFEVVGVDKVAQSRYPFEFICADAMDFLRHLVFEEANPTQIKQETRWPLDFAAIHASPPCQEYSKALRHMASPQPTLIAPVLELLRITGLPWVVENVVGAPLPSQSDLFGHHGVELCGSMFGLHIRRHRLFECSFPIEVPRGCNHSRRAMNPHNPKGRALIGYAPETQWRNEMGVPWMNKDETRQAIPPSMTEHIGHYLLAEVNRRAEVPA